MPGVDHGHKLLLLLHVLTTSSECLPFVKSGAGFGYSSSKISGIPLSSSLEESGRSSHSTGLRMMTTRPETLGLTAIMALKMGSCLRAIFVLVPFLQRKGTP